MKTSPSWRAIALAALASTALLPASASARPGIQPEPIVILSGAVSDCIVDGADAQTSALRPLVEATTVGGARTDAAYKWGVTPIPSSWLYHWTTADGYTQCTQPVVQQGRNLYNRIQAKIAQWNASLPAGYAPVTKVDIVASSMGSLVSRSCIANTGRGNPANETPGCAALVDDWAAMVPPSHGTTNPGSIGCPYAGLPLCAAIKVGADFQLKLNERYNGLVPDLIGAGDETPQIAGTTPIEYTTMWAGNDGLIVPAASAALWGAGNFKVESGVNGAADTVQLNHGNIADPGLCPGSPNYTTSGTWEWIAWALLDSQNHWTFGEESPRQFPTAIAPTAFLNCKVGPPGI